MRKTTWGFIVVGGLQVFSSLSMSVYPSPLSIVCFMITTACSVFSCYNLLKLREMGD